MRRRAPRHRGQLRLVDQPNAPSDRDCPDPTVLPLRLSPAGHVRPRELVLVCLAVALVCAAYLALAWYDFDLLDEGYFLTHARRIQLGGLPYRDFSTPYTPGVFYLYAWILDHFGPNMVALRTPGVLGRGAEFLALYLLGRRLMSPFFAALAPLLILGIDRAPPMWSIHPGWFATPASLVAVMALARYMDGGRARWLLVSGAASGVGFLFKQNLAAYGLMAALWFVVVAERYLPPVSLRWPGGTYGVTPGAVRMLAWCRVATQAGALALLPLTAAVIVRPYLSPLVAALFVIPLAALSLAALPLLGWRRPPAASEEAGPRSDMLGSDAGFFARPLLLFAGFAAVTLPWLIVLLKALNWRFELLGGFVGNIDPSGYYYGMEPPQDAHLILVGTLLLAPVAVALLGRIGFWGGASVGFAAGTLGGLAVAGLVYPWGDQGFLVVPRWILTAAARWWNEYRDASPHPTDDLVLWLPVLAFWPALALLVVHALRNGGWTAAEKGVRPGSHWLTRVALRRLLYVAAGAALILTQYPRMGYGHIVWSGGVIFVVGADLLHGAYRQLVGRVTRLGAAPLGRAALCFSLAAFPAVAALPYLQERTDRLAFIYQALTVPASLEPGDRLVPLEIWDSGNRVWAPAEVVNPEQIVVFALRESTQPGEPIFAYPAIPGFYFLADRPNATRFNHLFAGMAGPADQEEMVRQLEGVRYMVWDDYNVYHWVKPEDNAPVVDYIRTHFHESLVFGPYAFLDRYATGPPRPKTSAK